MIFDYRRAEEVAYWSETFALIPSFTWGYYALLLLLLVTAFAYSERFGATMPAMVGRVLPYLLYAATFVAWYGASDEVAVNLEHIYNFYHHGLFSMSPTGKVDGTIEFVYYALHYPFAATPQLLFAGNFLIGATAGVVCLAIYDRWLAAERHQYRWFLASLFALSYPVIGVFATGFGNGLLGIFILLSAISICRGRYTLALLASGVLPLIRPDGLAWSLVLMTLLLCYVIRQRQLDGLKALGWRWLLFAAPFIVAAGYWRFFEQYYGVSYSTPMMFKGFSVDRLMLFDFARFATKSTSYFKELTILFAVAVCLITLFFRVDNTRGFIKAVFEPRFIWFFAALPPAILFIFAQNLYVHIGDDAYRYWVGSSLFLHVALALCLPDMMRQFGAVVWRRLSYAFLLVLMVNNLIFKPPPSSEFWVNRHWAADAGYMVRELVTDTDLTLATSEMNTFGLMIPDRHVVDYWGYSNQDIASSTLCNTIRIRVNPSLLLEQQPDIFWPYWMFAYYGDYQSVAWRHIRSRFFRLLLAPNALLGDDLLGDPDFPALAYRPDFPETYYDDTELNVTKLHMYIKHQMLGHTPSVMRAYNVFYISAENITITLLVHRDKTATLQAQLADKGFELMRERALDHALISDEYGTGEDEYVYPC